MRILYSKMLVFQNLLGPKFWTVCWKWSPCSGHAKLLQLCLTLCDPMDCNLPGSTVHGILQARILVWVAISFSRGSSQPRGWTQVSHIAGRFFTLWATREAPYFHLNTLILFYSWFQKICGNSSSHLLIHSKSEQSLWLFNWRNEYLNRRSSVDNKGKKLNVAS